MNDLTIRRFEEPRLYTGHPAADGADLRTREAVSPLTRMLRIARRWKWLIIGSIIVAGISGLVLTLLTTPLYTASVTLEIQRDNLNIVQVEGVEPKSGQVDQEFYQTQYGLLQAESLAERVAADLRLYQNPDFFEMFGAAETAGEVREAGARAPTAALRRERIREAAEILLEHVSIAPERQSRLVDVQFTSPDPRLSADVMNAWSRLFIATNLERRFEATSYARRFLEERLAQLRQRLEESERLLVSYAANQRIISLPTSTSQSEGGQPVTTERPIVAEDLSALNQELNEATAARIAAQSRLGSGAGTTAEAVQNQSIGRLRERRAELVSERARLLTQFEPGYPPAQALGAQIGEINSAIAREEARVKGSLQEAYSAASARETALKERVEGLQSNLLDLRRRSIQYNIYQREVDTNRQLYDGLLQRYKEIGVAGGVGSNNVAIVDAAKVPERPSSPSFARNLLLSLLLGAVVGAGLAFAREQMDEAIADPSDVEEALGLPLLGAIPRATSSDPRMELEDPKSPLVEAYLSAQTRLGFTTDHGIPRTLAITSTRPGEGKSTTSFALARSLARMGRSVILVDADMRSPSLHEAFDVENNRGLSNFLAGDGDLRSLIHDTEWRMAFLSAGPTPPNAAELLNGGRVPQLLEELTALYQHVVLDLPPVMGLADTPLIAGQVEGAIYVVESHATKASMARMAVGRLQDAHARLLGVLLTKFDSKRAHHGYGYDYGYGYGEEHGERDRKHRQG